MRIYFVRHGNPDYAKDCLTPLGQKQAAAVADRLADRNITQVFSSTKGRAMETAGYTARKLGLEIIPCDFIRELGWASADGEPILAGGDPWTLAEIFAAEGKSLWREDWRVCEPFCRSKVVKRAQVVEEGLDTWLEGLGYRREGDYYRVLAEDSQKNVAMFSHAGAFSAAFAHLFHIPFPQVCGMLHLDFTAVTVVDFSGKEGALIYPKLIQSDAEHIRGIEGEHQYGN